MLPVIVQKTLTPALLLTLECLAVSSPDTMPVVITDADLPPGTRCKRYPAAPFLNRPGMPKFPFMSPNKFAGWDFIRWFVLRDWWQETCPGEPILAIDHDILLFRGWENVLSRILEGAAAVLDELSGTLFLNQRGPLDRFCAWAWRACRDPSARSRLLARATLSGWSVSDMTFWELFFHETREPWSRLMCPDLGWVFDHNLLCSDGLITDPVDGRTMKRLEFLPGGVVRGFLEKGETPVRLFSAHCASQTPGRTHMRSLLDRYRATM